MAAGLGSSASGVLADDGAPPPVVAAADLPVDPAVGRVVDAPIALDDVQAAEPVPQPVLGLPSPAQPPTRLEPPPPDPPPADPGLATPGTARTNANCLAIEAEFLVQGAEPAVADQFAYVIAPRSQAASPSSS